MPAMFDDMETLGCLAVSNPAATDLVKIEISTDGGLTYNTITAGTLLINEHYLWDVLSAATNQAKLRFSKDDILPDCLVLAPLAGNTIYRNQPFNIQWLII